MAKSNYAVGPIQAKGAVTVDFGLPGDLPFDELPSVIERDRMHMAKRPGLRQKHLPILIDSTTGNYLSGGRYLFDSVEHAEQYKAWARDEFILDGTKFFERPFFIDPVCYVWKVIGAHDLADMHASHQVIRSELWQLPAGHEHELEQYWPQIYKEAERCGLSSVWLLHNEPEHLAGIISIASREMPPDSEQPDDASLHSFESSPSLGTMFEQAGASKVFDRTSWVLTIWFPIAEGEPDVPALWPNSPPLPAPAYAQARMKAEG
jgi:hypothetical protein